MNYIIANIGYFLELLMIQMYFGMVWKERIWLKWYGWLLFILNALLLTGINAGAIPGPCVLLVHGMLILFSYFRYKKGLKVTIVNSCIIFMLAWGTEIVAGMINLCVMKYLDTEIQVFMSNNMIMMIISIICSCFIKRKKSRRQLCDNIGEYVRTIVLNSLLLLSVVVIYFFGHQVRLWYAILLVIFEIMIYLYLQRLQKTEHEVRQKEMELNVNRVYGAMYEELIQNVRRKQHEYKNQLAAIYSAHKTTSTREELVECQRTYCDAMEEDSEYECLLTCCNEPVLAGFLYYKCLACKEREISVCYHVSVDAWSSPVLLHEVIELLGIFLDNAMEQEEKSSFEKKYIGLEFLEDEDVYNIRVSNRITNDTSVCLTRLFESGYSTRGDNRGYGLSRAKQICDRHGLALQVHIESDGERQIVFRLAVPLKSRQGKTKGVCQNGQNAGGSEF